MTFFSDAGRGGAVVALLALAGCGEGGFPGFGGASGQDSAPPAVAAGQTTQLVERDVEAPEVFQVTDEGLWDGRPSLGGVWVAHPDVVDPERVIIRNTETGTFVIGALFRRERDNPGPALQVSSDAAEALGLLAGAPAELNVTALRREDAPPDAAASPPLTAPEPVVAAQLDPVPAVETTPLAAPDAPPVALADALAAITAAPASESAPAPGPVPEADLAAALPAPAPTPAPAPAPPPAAGDLQRPFIQIGIFSVEANARGAAADFEAKGLPARVVDGTVQGQTFWRVLVGPAATEAERASLLDRVKAEGFADAYFVRS